MIKPLFMSVISELMLEKFILPLSANRAQKFDIVVFHCFYNHCSCCKTGEQSDNIYRQRCQKFEANREAAED